MSGWRTRKSSPRIIAGGASMRAAGRRSGFTLVEVMVATVVVGIGVSAALYGMTASVSVSNTGYEVLESQKLAGYIYDYCQILDFVDPDGEPVFGPEDGELGIEDYDDIDDLHDLTLSPPIDSNGRVLTLMPQWSQKIQVMCLDPATLQVLQNPSGIYFLKIEVIICNGTRTVKKFETILTDWI